MLEQIFPKCANTLAGFNFTIWTNDSIKENSAPNVNFFVKLASSVNYKMGVCASPVTTVLGRHVTVGADYNFIGEKN